MMSDENNSILNVLRIMYVLRLDLDNHLNAVVGYSKQYA